MSNNEIASDTEKQTPQTPLISFSPKNDILTQPVKPKINPPHDPLDNGCRRYSMRRRLTYNRPRYLKK